MNLSILGTAGGTSNTITGGIKVQYSEPDYGATWSAWAAYTTVCTIRASGSISVASSSTCGQYRRFQLRTLVAAGYDWYSGC